MSHSESIELAVEQFLAHKRALGRKYLSEEEELRLLVALRRRAGRALGWTSSRRRCWMTSWRSRPRSRPRSFNHLLGVVSVSAGLGREPAAARGLAAARPPTTGHRQTGSHSCSIPSRHGGCSTRPARCQTTPGRRSEERPIGRSSRSATGSGCASARRAGCAWATSTRRRDLLVVRGGKFGKSRLVPHGPRIAALLDEQLERRHRRGARRRDGPLFTFDGSRSVHPGTASQTFHQLVRTLELVVPDGVSPPRLHSLRHSFAVGCLLRWYRQGLDPSAGCTSSRRSWGTSTRPRPRST